MFPSFKLPREINLAFSCGKDSISFAHFLGRNHKINLVHVNNGLMGDNETEEKVIQFARLFRYNINVHKYGPCNSKNLEEGCRNARLQVFQKYDHIVICHHLGDAIENYLKNCFCGNSSYKPIQEISWFDHLIVLRPFLKISPKRISKYLVDNNLHQYISIDRIAEKSERTWMREKLIGEINSRYNLENVVKRFYM